MWLMIIVLNSSFGEGWRLWKEGQSQVKNAWMKRRQNERVGTREEAGTMSLRRKWRQREVEMNSSLNILNFCFLYKTDFCLFASWWFFFHFNPVFVFLQIKKIGSGIGLVDNYYFNRCAVRKVNNHLCFSMKTFKLLLLETWL